MNWSNGHKFAFTVFDDTDWATVQNVKPVYDLLSDIGMRTTKSVWMLDGEGTPMIPGTSCQNRAYRDWILSLQKQGFEIALHNAAPVTSPRQQTHLALDRFRDLFGGQMLIHCNHMHCGENMYWGDARLTGWRTPLYNALTRGRRRGMSRGHLPGDPLFWGDLCGERVSYVRNFVFDNLNTLAACPDMPYHDAAKPFVNFWFAASDGAGIRRFLKNFTLERIDRLVEAGGLCIAYVHFAAGFVTDGRIHPEFRRRMEHIASKDGWFVPVSEVLDSLRGKADRNARQISPARLRRLELGWLGSKILKGTT